MVGWVLEHQTRLQVAFEGAGARLRAAADRRKEQHDQKVRDVPFLEGQLVHLRDHSVRGRNKIQDLWSSVVYRVLKPPKDGGSVYTIAPLDDLDKVKHVNRTLLKVHHGSLPLDHSHRAHSMDESEAPSEAEEDDSLDGGELWVSRPEPQAAPGTSCPLTGLEPPLLQPPPGDPLPVLLGSPSTTHRTEEQLSTSGTAARRTIRTTAGQHHNVHRLPESAESRLRGATNSRVLGSTNAGSVIFRPWK